MAQNQSMSASVPFFARFLETQESADIRQTTLKYPSDREEGPVTRKYPSDFEDR